MRHGDYKILARLSLPTYIAVNSANSGKVKNATLSDFRLFKVSTDLHESKDLSAIEPGRFAELKKLLETEYASLVEDSHVWEDETLKITGHRGKKSK
jgi:arylsulfatase A